MNHRDIEVLMQGIAPVIHELIASAFKSLAERIAALESREPIAGPAGKDGAPGLDGKDGAPGLDGKDGLNGKDGVDGRNGVDGRQGEPGRDGVDGTPGADGAKGQDGLPGRDGVDGAEGKPGQAGPQGPEGKRGASVMDGHVDDNGMLHLRMSDGRNIPVGIVRGSDGRPGESVQGRSGRDAVEISILRSVDESRSYGAGTCAYWRGGVIRAERDTSPINNGDIFAAGWSVMLRGIAEEFEETVDDGRTIVRTTVYTDGSESNRTIKTACVIDRGVWRDASYDKGDGVTYSGSFFIAQRETHLGEKPGQSDGWRLAVKRGRDGQDGKIRETKPVKV